MTLSDADRARIKAEQAQAWADGVRKLAQEHPSPDPPASRKPNGNGSHHAGEGGSWDGPPLPPPEAYESMAEVPRGTPAEAAGEPPERPPLPGPIPWDTLQGLQPPARLWWIQDWLTPGATLLAGPGGAGKSLVTQALLTGLAVQQNYIGPILTPKRSLLWACEDDREELWRRQLALCEMFSCTLGDLERLHVIPRAGHDNTLLTAPYGVATPTPLMARLREQVNDLNVDVLALDNVRQCFAGNENSGHDPTTFVNALLGLVTDRPFAVLLLHHTSKSQASEFAGNMAWENAVRSRWYLGPRLPDARDDGSDADPDPAVRFLARRKSNYSANDYVKLLWQEGKFVPQSDTAVSAAAYGKQAEYAEDAVKFAVAQAYEAGIRVVRAPNSPSSLVRYMREAQFGVGIPDKLLRAAITQLLMRRVIIDAEVGRDTKRRPIAGLVPAGTPAIRLPLGQEQHVPK